jgi:hypothetical protein
MVDPYNSDTQALITQLQQQQALFTQIVKAQLEGRWTGEASAEALLYALDPNMQGTLNPDIPITQSEYEPPKAG